MLCVKSPCQAGLAQPRQARAHGTTRALRCAFVIPSTTVWHNNNNSTMISFLHKVANTFFDLDAKMRQKAADCLVFVKQNATQNDPASVVAAIDAFAAKHFMMNVGDHKGAIVDDQIRAKKPLIMAELGAYAGYSAVRFASLQKQESGQQKSHFYSFEYSPECAAIVKEMVAFAGLSDQVTVITGAFADQIDVLKGKQVDIVFIDHEKSVYLADAKLILANGLLRKGSLLIADNVIVPGAPDYLAFIEAHPQFKTKRHEAKLSGFFAWQEWKDAISVAEFQG